MKQSHPKPFLLGTLLALLAACTATNTEKETTYEIPIESQPSKITFSGYWVNQSYVQALQETQSPRTAQEQTELSAAYIPAQTEDTLMVIFNFHEGIPYRLRREPDGKLNAYPLDGGETAYSVEYVPEKRFLKLGKELLIRLKNQSDEYPVVEEFLFAGKYNLGGNEITFTADGKVTGIDSLAYYAPITDYLDAGMQVDQVMLGQSKDQLKPYGFAFRDDTLTIYQLHCKNRGQDNQLCEEVENGKELLQLVKK